MSPAGRGRSYTANDNIGEPCNCLECQAAGITDRPIRFIPGNEFNSRSHWAHGVELKNWYVAYDQARADFQAAGAALDLDPKKLKQALR